MRAFRLALGGLATLALVVGQPTFGNPVVPTPGTNDPSCRPNAILHLHPEGTPQVHRHPPVILVHGTASTSETMSFFATSLRASGYCPWATDLPTFALGHLQETRNFLRSFADQVRSATGNGDGSGKVSMIGHSQGGLQIRYMSKSTPYLVDDAISLAGVHKGTETPLLIPCSTFAAECQSRYCPACYQQWSQSWFWQQEMDGCVSQTCVATPFGSASYTQIVSVADEFVFPYWRALLRPADPLPGPPAGQIADVVLQTYCPADASDHMTILSDVNALRIALDALARQNAPANPGAIPCT